LKIQVEYLTCKGITLIGALDNLWTEMGANMNEQEAYKLYQEVFELLIKADEELWSAVKTLHAAKDQSCIDFAKTLLELRGEIHSEAMRPIYKKYPELAEKAGF